MIIKKITIEEYKQPFTSKTFLGKELFSFRKGWYIKIYNEDSFGIGEAAPIPNISVENHNEVGYALEGFSIALEGIDYKISMEELLLLSDVHGYKKPSVKFAIQSAIFDLYSKSHNQTISKYLNKESLELINLNNIYNKKSTIRSKDTNILKIKINSTNLFEIRDKIDRILSNFPNNIKLRLDFNGGLDLTKAIRVCKELSSYNIDYLEQPTIKNNDLYELRMISDIPIAVDESLTDPQSLNDIIKEGAADVLVIKPTLTGGLEDIKKLLHIAKIEGLRSIFTSSFETHISQLFILHLIASLKISEHCGLFNIDLFNDKLPKIIKDQCKVPQSKGIGSDE